jgi:flagellar hook-basal body complex protein FliE
MDALSALKMVAGPDLGTNLNKVVADASTKSIPLQDLQKLNPDIAAQSIGAAQSGSATGGSFQNLLTNFVGEVNTQQSAANDAITGLLSGKNVSLHQAMISMQEASVSFQMMVEVRNKLLDSYQELMRMQV